MKRLLLILLTFISSLPYEPLVANDLVSACASLATNLRRLILGPDANETAPKIIGTDPLFIESAAFDFQRTSEFFRRERRLILRQELDIEGGAFPVSNEYDFFRTNPLHDHRDLVVGFGTNSAWDMAVRVDAKTLVLADWQEAPLLGQEYLFRPFILVATDAAEFFAFVAGAPIPKEMKGWPLDRIMDALNSNARRTPALGRLHFMNSVIERIRRDSRFTDVHIQFVARYFHFLLTRDYATGQAKPNEEQVRQALSSGLMARNVAGPFRGYQIEVIAGDLFAHLYERYHPRRMMDRGATADELLHPFYSAFSSESSFQRLQRIFDGSTFYVQASLYDPKLWSSVKELGQSRGASSHLASLSNIVDCSYGGCREGPGTVRNFLQLIYRSMGPIDVFQTRGTQSPLQYEHFPLKAESDIPQQLRQKGYPEEELTSRPRRIADRVNRLMGANDPVISQIYSDRVEINYGQNLLVILSKPRPGSKDFGIEFHLRQADGSRQIVFFDIPDNYRRIRERVVLELGELRETNEALNKFFHFYSENNSGTPKPPSTPRQ